MKTDSADDYGLAPAACCHESDIHLQVDGDVQQTQGVFVIFTDVPGTLAALQLADALAGKLAAHLQLLMPYEVPYTLPLTRPAVPVEFLQGQIRNLACKTRLDVAAHIYLCRDRRRTLELLLKPHCLIVLGGKKRWWPTPVQKLARELQRGGHDVIFAELR